MQIIKLIEMNIENETHHSIHYVLRVMLHHRPLQIKPFEVYDCCCLRNIKKTHYQKFSYLHISWD